MSRALLLAILTLLLCGPPPCQAQVNLPVKGTHYRLVDTASFQEGCFDPCLCPLGARIAMHGTFVLGEPIPGNVFDFRHLTDIHWTVNHGDTLVHTITGNGVYKVTNWGTGRSQSLELYLSIDGASPQYFFSDLVPSKSRAPAINVPVSINGVYCHDIVIEVNALPVPRDEMTPYVLAEGSTFQQGCFDPCDCLLEEPRPMEGSFTLVPLLQGGTYAEYALVGIGFSVPGNDAGDNALALSGVGRYILIQGFAGPFHSMELALEIDGGAAVHFDQEGENTSTIIPDIDISVDMNDMVCFDRILTIVARPGMPFPRKPR